MRVRLCNAALDVGYVCAGEPGALRERVLREVQMLAPRSQHRAGHFSKLVR
jgi:hypothetical protein